MKITFAINLIVMCLVIGIVMLFFWASGADAQTIAGALTGILPTAIVLLQLHDLVAKLFARMRLHHIEKLSETERTVWLAEHVDDRTLVDRLSVAYYVGVAFVLGSSLFFVLASQQPDIKGAAWRLGLSIFLGVLAFIWYYFPYRKGVQTDAEIATEAWAKTKRRIKRAASTEDCIALVRTSLYYHLLDDSYSSALDFERPLGSYKGKLYTYAGLAKLYLKTKSDDIAVLMSDFDTYITLIVAQVAIKEKK